MSRRRRLRFGFRLVDGAQAGLSCGGWRVWTHSEDTYITAKPLGDTWKVSLHADDWWATAVTSENAQREDGILPASLPRSAWRFQPTELVDGSRIAFGIGVFRHALREEPIDRTETVISVPDRWDLLSLALVRMTEPGVDAHPDWTLVGGPQLLASGRRVWVTSSFEQIDPADPEPVAPGTMIEPVTPETHGVASPGWLGRAFTSPKGRPVLPIPHDDRLRSAQDR